VRVRLLAPAQAELDEAVVWYSTQAPGLGESFLVEVLRSIQLIQRHPTGWHPLTPDIRRCRLRRFPYSVIYTVEADEVLILAVAHQHRRPSYWQDRTN
jgi:plasmid stabilization system protein ParE